MSDATYVPRSVRELADVAPVPGDLAYWADDGSGLASQDPATYATQATVDTLTAKVGLVGAQEYDLYNDSGVKLKRRNDNAVVFAGADGAGALSALLAEGDVPVRVNVRGRNGPILLGSSGQPMLPAGRAYAPEFVGEHMLAGFQVSSASVPKPFDFASGTLSTPRRYRLPTYRHMTLDANVALWLSGPAKTVSFFGPDTNMSFMFFEPNLDSEELRIKAGVTNNDLIAHGQDFRWWNLTTQLSGAYEPSTAAWVNTGPLRLRFIYGMDNGLGGGLGFVKFTGQWPGSKGAAPKVLIPGCVSLYHCEYDAGAQPNTTDGGFCYVGFRYYVTDVSMVHCYARNIGDVAHEINNWRRVYGREVVYENIHSALFRQRVNSYYSSSDVDFEVEIIGGKAPGFQNEGVVIRTEPSVTIGSRYKLDIKRVHKRMPTATSEPRHALNVEAAAVAPEIDATIHVEDVGDHEDDHLVSVAAGGTVTDTAHGYTLGDAVGLIELSGAAPLAQGVEYYVRDVTTNTYTLSATVGGAAISTSAGAGRIQRVPAWLFDGSSSGSVLMDQVRLSGGTAQTPCNVRVRRYSHKIRGKKTAAGGSSGLFLDGFKVDPSFNGRLMIDEAVIDARVYGDGLANGHYRLIRMGPGGGGSSQGQEDTVTTDGTTATWTITASGTGFSGTSAAISGSASAAAVQAAIIAISSGALAGKVTVSKSVQGANTITVYTVDWDPTLGVVTDSVAGNATIETVIAYGTGATLHGGWLKNVRFAAGSLGIPQPLMVDWDASVALLGKFTQHDWHLYDAPTGIQQNQFEGARPANLLTGDIWLPGKYAHHGGIVQIAADGAALTFNVAHSLGEDPTPRGSVVVTPHNSAAKDAPDPVVTADASNYTFAYWAPPPAGTLEYWLRATTDVRL